MEALSLIRRWVLLLFATLLCTPLLATEEARAHNTWIQPTSTVVEPGEPVYLDVFLGNHSRNHRSYRIAGKVDPAEVTLTVYGPDGRAREAGPLVDYGEDSDAVPPAGVKGYLGAQLVPRDPGVYLIALISHKVVQSLHPSNTPSNPGSGSHDHGQPMQHGASAAGTGGQPDDSSTFHQHITAKTFVAAVEGSRHNARRLTRGWNQAVSPEGMELVPLQNPATVRAGDTVAFQLLLKGEPAPGETVGIIRRSDGWFQDAVADAKGVVRFRIPAADYYLLTAMATRESPQGDLEAFEATLTFMADASSSR